MRSKLLLGSLLLALFMVFSGNTLAADIKLPPPQTEGGMSLFEAMKKRSSAPGGDFSLAEIKLEELSTILWAASGLNRGDNGWTVPMGKGRPPYCRVYVAGADGVYLYDWAAHSLRQISADNIKAKIGKQSFVKKAYYILIIVSDGEGLAYFAEKEASEYGQVLASAMTQDIYLACAALKIGTRYIHQMHVDAIKEALALPAGDEPICLMLLGK